MGEGDGRIRQFRIEVIADHDLVLRIGVRVEEADTHGLNAFAKERIDEGFQVILRQRSQDASVRGDPLGDLEA